MNEAAQLAPDPDAKAETIMTTHRARPAFSGSLAAALCLALAGCTGPTPPAGEPATAAGSAPGPASAEQLADVSPDELRKRAQLAVREQRVFAPAGDNAIELYVALRGRGAPSDADAQGALMELQPYAVIGAEQAIARGDFAEAERLRGLVAAIDPGAPSLGRIAQAIAAETAARAQKALEVAAAAEVLAKPEPAAEASQSAPLPVPGLPVVSAPSPAPAPATVAAPATPSPPSQAAPTQATPPATPQAASRAVASRPASELIPVRTPAPEFPDHQRPNGKTGQVVASFTVLPDGTVGNIGLESVGAKNLGFERSVLRALKRWKYQPPGEERSVKQAFAFGQ